MEVKGHNKVTFTPDKQLAEAVNQPFAQFESVFLSDELTDEKLAEIDAVFPSALDENDDKSSPSAVTGQSPQPEPLAEPEPVPEPPVVSEPEPEPVTDEEPVGRKALAAFGVQIGRAHV